MGNHDRVQYRESSDWLKIRVWWLARHRFRGTTHLAASIPNGKVTRCGLRFYVRTSGKRTARSREFGFYDWTRLGRDIEVPTCPQCQKLYKWDQGGQLGNPVA